MYFADPSFGKWAVRAAIALTIGASPSLGQTVWQVDGINHASVDSAYAVASPGDVILVTLQDAPIGFLSGKGVRIIAGLSGLRLNATSSGISGIPAGQQLVITGFTLDCSILFFSLSLVFLDCPGSLVLENCTGYANPNSSGLNALRFLRCDDVQLFDCSWQGRNAFRSGSTTCTSSFGSGSPGLRLEDSRATIVGGNFGGGNSAACPFYCSGCWPATYPGGSGIEAVRSQVSVHECALRGGLGNSSTGNPAPNGSAVVMNASQLWISPTPAEPISGDAGSIVNAYGIAPTIVGALTVVHVSTPLPAMQARLSSNVLSINATSALPLAPCHFGASLRSGFIDLGPFGHLGLLEMDYASSQSLLLGTGAFDSRGSFRASFSIPPPTIQNLRYQDFRLQLLTVDSRGQISVSGVDFIVIPG